MEKHTLIIIPGWGGSHETWESFIKIAKNNFEVVCVDLPGFGGVSSPSSVWGVEEYAAYVKQKIEELPLGRKTLIGHSFGGQVSAYLVANSPKICDRYVLYAGAVFRPKRLFRRIFFGTVAKLGKLLFRIPVIEHIGVWAKKALYKASDSPDYTKTSGIQREIFKKIIRQDLTEELPKIKIPTLIIWGSFDSYLPVKDAYQAQKLISGAKIEIIQGGGHGLHLHHTKQLFSFIEKFARYE